MFKNKLLLILIILLSLVLTIGCSPKEETKTPEEIVQEGYEAFEKDAIETAKEFVLATEGNKDKIKELAFVTLLKDIEEKNWSIMLVDEMNIEPNTLEFTTEKLGEKQVLVRVFYEGKMKMDGDEINVKLSNKVGIIAQDGALKVFSFE